MNKSRIVKLGLAAVMVAVAIFNLRTVLLKNGKQLLHSFPFFLLNVILCFIIASCQSQGSKLVHSQAGIINMDSASTELWRYSELFKNVRLIPLETKDVLLSSISKMVPVNDTLYLMDRRTEGVYAFKKDGSFIRKFGNSGPAPGEYAGCRDFTVDEEKRKLYLYDSSRNKILRYDLLTGSFEDEISLGGQPFYADIAYQSDFLYVYQSKRWPEQGDTPYHLLHQIDLLQAGKVTVSLLDCDSYNQGWQNEFLNVGNPFTRVGEELWFCTALMDTVMAIRGGEVYPVWAIHGEKVIKRDDILKENGLNSSGSPVALTKKMMQQYMHLTQNQTYFSFSNFFVHQGDLWFNCNGGSLLKVRHHLKSGQTSIFREQKDDVFFSENEQNGITLPGYLCADAEGVFYCYNTEQLEELKSLFNSGQLSDKVVNKELIKSLDSDSNPVLLYYEFKD